MGLKILVSAVQSRPSPPFFLAACPSGNFLRREFVPKLCLTRAHSSAFQRTRRDRVEHGARVSALLRATVFTRQDYPGSTPSGVNWLTSRAVIDVVSV